MTTDEQMRKGGRRLREMREALDMTQLDIERLSLTRFGPEGKVFAQQVSRIEKGVLDKPPILDLLSVGRVLGLQPDDIAEMFGLWPRQEGERKFDPRLTRLIEMTDTLPFEWRERLLDQVDTIVALMRAEARRRDQGDRQREEELSGHDAERTRDARGAGAAGGPGGSGGSWFRPVGKGGARGEARDKPDDEPVDDDDLSPEGSGRRGDGDSGAF